MKKAVLYVMTMAVWSGLFYVAADGKTGSFTDRNLVAMEPVMERLEIGEMPAVPVTPATEGQDRKEPETVPVMPSPEELRAITDFSEFKTQWKGMFVLPAGDALLELYHFDEKRVRKYAAALNQFAQKMPPEIRMYSLLAPTRVGLTGDRYRDYSDPQEKAIAYAYALLDSRYRAVQAFPLMAAHGEEYLHFRSDHHWTQLGAYYAAKAFAEQAEFSIRELSEYEIRSKEGFLGYLYEKNNNKEVAGHPDRIDLYTYRGEAPKIAGYVYKEDGSMTTEWHPVVDTTGKRTNYRAFLGGDFPLAVYTAPKAVSGRRLMIVKDSYANAFATWLTPYFDKIILIDPRHYRGNIYHLARKEKITDFVVVDYVMATELEGFIGYLKHLSER